MRNLVNKELRLSINKFFFLLPFILGLLFFIPGWIYILAFMYFFWVTVPQIFSAYLNQKDYDFMTTLPVAKKDIVTSKAVSMYIIELLHILAAVIFTLIHNELYGSWNFFMDLNVAFFGVGILMFGIFNIVFLPGYFKTAYFFGKPLIIATAVTLVYGFIFEYGVIKFSFMQKLLEGNLGTQFWVLGVGVIVSVILSIYAIRISIKKYESII
ncbi:MAG: ABC-2 transporter permease [Acholeplasmataceae bacterium]